MDSSNGNDTIQNNITAQYNSVIKAFQTFTELQDQLFDEVNKIKDHANEPNELNSSTYYKVFLFLTKVLSKLFEISEDFRILLVESPLQFIVVEKIRNAANRVVSEDDAAASTPLGELHDEATGIQDYTLPKDPACTSMTSTLSDKNDKMLKIIQKFFKKQESEINSPPESRLLPTDIIRYDFIKAPLSCKFFTGSNIGSLNTTQNELETEGSSECEVHDTGKFLELKKYSDLVDQAHTSMKLHKEPKASETVIELQNDSDHEAQDYESQSIKALINLTNGSQMTEAVIHLHSDYEAEGYQSQAAKDLIKLMNESQTTETVINLEYDSVYEAQEYQSQAVKDLINLTNESQRTQTMTYLHNESVHKAEGYQSQAIKDLINESQTTETMIDLQNDSLHEAQGYQSQAIKGLINSTNETTETMIDLQNNSVHEAQGYQCQAIKDLISESQTSETMIDLQNDSVHEAQGHQSQAIKDLTNESQTTETITELQNDSVHDAQGIKDLINSTNETNETMIDLQNDSVHEAQEYQSQAIKDLISESQTVTESQTTETMTDLQNDSGHEAQGYQSQAIKDLINESHTTETMVDLQNDSVHEAEGYQSQTIKDFMNVTTGPVVADKRPKTEAQVNTMGEPQGVNTIVQNGLLERNTVPENKTEPIVVSTNNTATSQIGSSVDLECKKDALVLKEDVLPIIGDTVIITHIETPSDFYVQVCDDKSAVLNQLNKYIRSVFENTVNTNNNKIEAEKNIGTYCVAYSTRFQMWFRAKIVDWLQQVVTDYVNVLAVDSGKRHYLSYKNLRPLRRDIAELPVMAIRCCLPNLYPPESTLEKRVEDWPSNSLTAFYSMTGLNPKIENAYSDEMMITFVQIPQKGEHILLDMRNPNFDSSSTIANLLLESGLAVEIYDSNESV